MLISRLYDKSTPGDRRKAEELVHEMVDTAIEMEGTCTGEHGVGMVKKEYLVAELGLETVETMRRIKVPSYLRLSLTFSLL